MTELEDRIAKLEKLSETLLIREHNLEPKNLHPEGDKLVDYPFMRILFVFLNQLDTFTLVTDQKDRVIYINQLMKDWVNELGTSFDLNSSAPWWEQIGWAVNPSDKGICTQECIEKRKVINHTIPSRYIDGLVYDVMCIPLKYNGVAAVLSLIRPVE